MTARVLPLTRPRPVPSPWRRRASYFQDAALVVVSALFFYVHARHVVADHVFTSVPFAAEQGVLVGIFLARRRSIATSTRFADWAVATGSWLPLVLQPGETGLVTAVYLGLALQLAGASLAFTCFGFLGRSFGIVAANRGLKTSGPYSLVRHPIYLAHTITISGFVLANFGLLNLAIAAVVTCCQLARIRAEERVLTESADYAAYKARVRWRLVPHVY